MKVVKQVVLFAVMAAILFGINAFTAPIIEKNNASAALGPLKEVMPEASGFETIYDVNDPTLNTLADVPETVQQVYVETSGLGYVVRLATTKGYTGEPIEITLAVNAEGKVANVIITSYPETRDVGEDYPSTYIGQDSALADVNLIAGTTYSSSAFKGAVEDGFNVLIANDVIKAGVKSDDQILAEMLPVVASGFANESGILQASEVSVSFADKAFVANNGSNAAYIIGNKLAVVNTSGYVSVYDTEGNVSSVDDGLASQIKDDAATRVAIPASALTRADKEFGEGNYSVVELKTHNSVVGAFESNGKVLFVANPYHFSNEPVLYYYVVNSDGSIASMSAKSFILEAEYFNAYTLNEDDYKAGFVGVTKDTYSDDVALISGATFSSSAGRVATTNVFESFDSMKGE